MLHPTSLAALAALAALITAASPSPSPNGFSPAKSAPDSPTKLDDCGCWPIYQRMLTCQKLHWPADNVRECVCIPNPDGWYTSVNGCYACLAPGSYEDNDFFDNLSRTIRQLFASCTETGGGIVSNGTSICASNAEFQACAALRSAPQPSWASFEIFDSRKSGNGSYVLDIAEYHPQNVSTATMATTTGTAALATATDTASQTSAGPSTTRSSSSSSTTTTTPSSSPSSSASAVESTRWPEKIVVALAMALGALAALS